MDHHLGMTFNNCQIIGSPIWMIWIIGYYDPSWIPILGYTWIIIWITIHWSIVTHIRYSQMDNQMNNHEWIVIQMIMSYHILSIIRWIFHNDNQSMDRLAVTGSEKQYWSSNNE